MINFLEAICKPTVWVIVVLELALLVFSIIRFIRTKSFLTLAIALITVGLFYDAFIIGLGAFVDANTMRAASQVRFISHGLLIPLLFVVCGLSLDLKKPWNFIIYGVTLLFMIAGVAEGFATVLEPVMAGGLSRMASAKDLTPKWAALISRLLSFGTVFPLIGVGIFVWIKQKNPFLFISGMLMLFFSAIGPAIGAKDYIFFISMFGEILMIIFMLLYTFKKEKRVI